MPAIVVKALGGMRPIREPHLLDPSEAVLASNVRLQRGSVEPLRASTTLQATTVINPATIWRYGNDAAEGNWWFNFLVDTDVISSPIPNDPHGRAYWTDGSTAKYGPASLLLTGASLPGGSFNLGVPAPTAAPAVAFTAGSGSTAETRSYVYTYVTAFGEEGPPSPPSVLATVDPTAPVNLSAMQTGPGGPYNINRKRIYRTSTVGASAQFQFVAEITLATTTYSDTISQALLGEALQTEDWLPPPAGLRGLKMLANGAAIGFVGNTIWLTEPNLPHAWAHNVPIELQIVGIGAFGNSAAILTNGYPFLLSGADPAAMTPQKLEFPYACLSKRGIVDTGDGCMYPSVEGLASISSAGISLVSGQFMSPDQWREYNPASMSAAYSDGRYHCLYTKTNGDRGMLTFDLKSGTLSIADTSADVPVTALHADPRSGTIYMAQGGNIVRFDKGSNLTSRWRSGIYRLARPANMAVASLHAESYPMTVRVIADGVVVHTATPTSAYSFRLPAGFEASDWQFEIEGSSKWTRFAMASSVSELMAAQ